jgi:uncharacterized protein YjbI with pentapeptide repeats
MLNPKHSIQPFFRRAADIPDDLTTTEDPSALLSGTRIAIADQILRACRLENLDGKTLLFERCILDRVALPNSKLGFVKLKDVRLVGCDLANVEFRAFQATRSEFLECRMTGLRLGEAECQDLLISRGDQSYSQFRFGKFKAAEFEFCVFQEADFYSADLQGCRFHECNLRNAEMSKVKLKDADLRGSKVEGLRLNAEDIQGAIVDAPQALTFAPLLGIRIC